MEKFKDFIHDDVVALGLEADSNLDALKKFATLLYEKKYVKESYIEAIQKRERSYPTGLQANGAGVAIPHTDVEHVNRPAIAVAVLKHPVAFELMGADSGTVDVEIIIMVAMVEPEAHNDLLVKLMSVLQDGDTLDKIKNAKKNKDVTETLVKFFQN